MNDEKDLGADAAVVDTARSASAGDAAIARHTEGPWMKSNRTFLTHNHPERRWESYVNTANTLAYVGCGVGETMEECVANAHLIAAAPELLAAAKLTALHFSRMDGNWDHFMGDDEHEAWTALNAAIAKAEGR